MLTTDQLARAGGEPPLTGRLRARHEDFHVTEIPLFEPAGEGEHCYLNIRKAGLNTAELGRQLARFAGVSPAAVSWAGLKDRNAITEQWFSVHLPGQPDPDWTQLNDDKITVLKAVRHTRKLKTGMLKGNHFRIRVTSLQGDLDCIDERILHIQQGVPNYFGEQRFGHDHRNVSKAQAMFENPKRRLKRAERSLLLSAARSQIFNAVLHRRVMNHNWDQLLPGEVCMLAGSHSVFLADDDETLPSRLAAHDIHPTGPMWGRGELMTQGICQELELQIAGEYSQLADGLEKAGLKQERRALRLVPEDVTWQRMDNELLVEFSLPPGAYATVVLRELINEDRP